MDEKLARKRLTAAGAEYQAVRDTLASARAQLHPAIVDAIHAGLKQAEIVKLSGFSREYIRRIERDMT